MSINVAKNFLNKKWLSNTVQKNFSAKEKALNYVSNSTRICLQDLQNNHGAKTLGHQVTAAHNQAGHTIGELQRAAKPPLGWSWGNFYRPWQRMFPAEKYFNGDINLRREYIPLSLLELQRIIDLKYLNCSKLIDICAICATNLIKIDPKKRQFGIHLTDEGAEIFSTKINLEVQWASLNAIAAIEKAGGCIRVAYYDLKSLQAAVAPKKWFLSGNPVPIRKLPPHSLLEYYKNPNYRGYLADDEACKQSALKLAKILNYDWKLLVSQQEQNWLHEKKEPTQVFLGIQPGSLISLQDKKIFFPTHSTLTKYYESKNSLVDYLQ